MLLDLSLCLRGQSRYERSFNKSKLYVNGMATLCWMRHVPLKVAIAPVRVAELKATRMASCSSGFSMDDCDCTQGFTCAQHRRFDRDYDVPMTPAEERGFALPGEPGYTECRGGPDACEGCDRCLRQQATQGELDDLLR